VLVKHFFITIGGQLLSAGRIAAMRKETEYEGKKTALSGHAGMGSAGIWTRQQQGCKA